MLTALTSLKEDTVTAAGSTPAGAIKMDRDAADKVTDVVVCQPKWLDCTIETLLFAGGTCGSYSKSAILTVQTVEFVQDHVITTLFCEGFLVSNLHNL